MLIARRAFLSQESFQVTLHACIPACDFTFPKFNRITVYFCSFSLLHRTFPQIKNARPYDFGSQFIRGQLDLFSLRSRDCAFSAQIQRKFSVNHTKSAYFQRKSRKVSVKVSANPRVSAYKNQVLYFHPSKSYQSLYICLVYEPSDFFMLQLLQRS